MLTLNKIKHVNFQSKNVIQGEIKEIWLQLLPEKHLPL